MLKTLQKLDSLKFNYIGQTFFPLASPKTVFHVVRGAGGPLRSSNQLFCWVTGCWCQDLRTAALAREAVWCFVHLKCLKGIFLVLQDTKITP